MNIRFRGRHVGESSLKLKIYWRTELMDFQRPLLIMPSIGSRFIKVLVYDTIRASHGVVINSWKANLEVAGRRSFLYLAYEK